MPLIHSKSKKAFNKNVETEMKEGKPLKQSLAIAYNLKRKAKDGKEVEHKAKGGEAGDEQRLSPKERALLAARGTKPMLEIEITPERDEKPLHSSMADSIVDAIMAKRMAEGGDVQEEEDELADFQPNEFDYLERSPAPEFSYTEENSGDDLSSPGEDERRKDMIDEIMKSRKLKG